MPLKCFLKPNRTKPRRWSAKTVGQVYCVALRDGVPRVDLEREIRKCVEPDSKRDSEAAEALAVAEQALLQNNQLLDADADSLQRFMGIPVVNAVVLRLISRIPIVGPVLAGAIPALRTYAAVRLGQTTVQKAANDAALVIVRRAAANERAFLRTGT